jgi:hypothetical protein
MPSRRAVLTRPTVTLTDKGAFHAILEKLAFECKQVIHLIFPTARSAASLIWMGGVAVIPGTRWRGRLKMSLPPRKQIHKFQV